jgi:hypothetical protein
MKQSSVALSEFDRSELTFVQERMGCSQSEAARTAIRVYAALLRGELPKVKKKGKKGS